ncbi:MAG: Hsp20/alpha crystallin family protein [Syntrophobacterales bacterium]|jgi:HSP20 family protein|nr:Hsp20/alpha crystallin family protein [Syntrophobacterales bacterium]
MAMIPWRPLWDTRFPSLSDEMDKMFEEFFEKVRFPSPEERSWVLPLDVYETKKEVIVTVDVPGVDPKKVAISIIDDSLTIKGEREKDPDLKDEELCRAERKFGMFQRIIQIPAEVSADTAKASYTNGVLKIVMPKTEKNAPKEVKVDIL